ncbi:MAG: hypothetical protein J6Y08_10495 [Clostridiales bacterium]|nr:hypothetical protein [Clostridiales bacterium]
MIALIRARLYSVVKSKSFAIFLVTMTIWALWNIIDAQVSSTISNAETAYIYWNMINLFGIILPVGASTWYGCFMPHHVSFNVPFQVDDKHVKWVGILTTYVLETAGFLVLMILAFVAEHLPTCKMEHSSAATTLKVILVIFLICFFRTGFVIFFTELTKSRLGGALFGIVFVCGAVQVFSLDLEVRIYDFLGITETTLPVTTHTTYFIYSTLLAMDDRHITFESTPMLGTCLYLLLVGMLFLGLTQYLIQKRDVE